MPSNGLIRLWTRNAVRLRMGSATTVPCSEEGSTERRNSWMAKVVQYSLPWTQPWIHRTGPSFGPRSTTTGNSTGAPSGRAPTGNVPSKRPGLSARTEPISIVVVICVYSICFEELRAPSDAHRGAKADQALDNEAEQHDENDLDGGDRRDDGRALPLYEGEDLDRQRRHAGPREEERDVDIAEGDDEGEDERREHAGRDQRQGHFGEHAQPRGSERIGRGFELRINAFEARDNPRDGEGQADEHMADHQRGELGHRKACEHEKEREADQDMRHHHRQHRERLPDLAPPAHEAHDAVGGDEADARRQDGRDGGEP